MLHLNGGNINSLNQTSLAVTQKHFSNPVKEQHQKTTHSMPHGKCKKSYLILEMEQRSKNKPNTMRQSITQRIQQEKATLSLGETRTPTQHGVMSKITALWRERGSIIIIFNNNPLSHHQQCLPLLPLLCKATKEPKRDGRDSDKNKKLPHSSVVLAIGAISSLLFVFAVAFAVAALILFKKKNDTMNYTKRYYELDKPLKLSAQTAFLLFIF